MRSPLQISTNARGACLEGKASRHRRRTWTTAADKSAQSVDCLALHSLADCSASQHRPECHLPDIVQMALLVDVDYAAVAVPLAYRFDSGGRGRRCPTVTAPPSWTPSMGA